MTPSRGANGVAGNMTTPGTLTANVVQQDYFAAVTTQRRAAAVQGTQQAVRPGVLVARSRWLPAQSGRQPERARPRHQRPDLARRNPQCRRRSGAHPRGAARSRLARYDRHHHHGRPWLLDHLQGEPDQRHGEDEVCRHAARPPAARLCRARSGACAQHAADRSRRRLQDHRRRRAHQDSATASSAATPTSRKWWWPPMADRI